MRRLLLRAAVLTGGCAAGILLSLGFSGTVYADDRPRLLDGLGDTITGVVDTVLPDSGRKQDKPDKDKDDKGNGKGDDEEPRQRPSRPIRDKVEEVVNEVIEEIDPPGRSDDNPGSGRPDDPDPDTEPDETVAAPDELAAVEPEPDQVTEPPDPIQAAPSADATSATPAATNPGEVYASYPPARACGGEHHSARDDRDDDRWKMAAKTPAERRASAVAPGYSTPTPPKPTGPDHDATPAVGAPCTPYTGLYQDATLTARATQPRTTAIRIPGRDQAADGMTRRPDAPSG